MIWHQWTCSSGPWFTWMHNVALIVHLGHVAVLLYHTCIRSLLCCVPSVPCMAPSFVIKRTHWLNMRWEAGASLEFSMHENVIYFKFVLCQLVLENRSSRRERNRTEQWLCCRICLLSLHVHGGRSSETFASGSILECLELSERQFSFSSYVRCWTTYRIFFFCWNWQVWGVALPKEAWRGPYGFINVWGRNPLQAHGLVFYVACNGKTHLVWFVYGCWPWTSRRHTCIALNLMLVLISMCVPALELRNMLAMSFAGCCLFI